MTAQTCIMSQHATLSGTTADTVTFSGRGASLCITNRDASTTLYFTFNGATAVSAADETYVVLPLQSKVITPYNGNVLSIVGNGNAYSAEIF